MWVFAVWRSLTVSANNTLAVKSIISIDSIGFSDGSHATHPRGPLGVAIYTGE
jgi:hypothetical protein